MFRSDLASLYCQLDLSEYRNKCLNTFDFTEPQSELHSVQPSAYGDVVDQIFDYIIILNKF